MPEPHSAAPRPRRRAVLLLALGTLGVVLAAGDVVLWSYAEHRLSGGLQQWRDAMEGAGWRVGTGRLTRGGFPLAATLTVDDVAIDGGQADVRGGVAWTAAAVELSLSPSHPRALRLGVRGRQTLRVGTIPAVALTAGSLTADVSDHADIVASDLRAGLADAPLSGAQGPNEARVAILNAHLSGTADATTFVLDLSQIRLPSAWIWPLGPGIAKLAADGIFRGVVPPGSDPRARAAAWRDDGGVLALDRATLDWGPLAARATAVRLLLDGALQPAGEADIRLGGWGETLDRLTQGNVLPAREAKTARAVLGLLAGSGSGEVALKLTLRDRTVSARTLPIARVPILDWPTP